MPWLAGGALALLVLGGCAVATTPSRTAAAGSRLFPPRLMWRSEKAALADAVKKDPFPEASQVGLQTARPAQRSP